MNTLQREAELFSRSLIGRVPEQVIIERYIAAVGQPEDLSKKDRALLAFAHNHPWSINMLDAGLALTRPHAELRRRLFLLFAILEATPDYHTLFLPQRRSPWYLIVIGLTGIRGVCRAIAGLVLVKVVVR